MRSLLTAAAIVLVGSTAMAADWTGGYVGAQIGYAKVKPSGGIADGSGGTYGAHIGYDYDFGDWVLGGEFDYDRLKIDVGNPRAATADSVSRAKIKLGYDFGTALGYVVAGPARVKTTLGDKTDAFYGLGVSFLASPQWSITGEYLYHKFKNVGGTGVDARADTFTLRASFRF